MGVPALPYHAGMDTPARTEHQARFQREEGLVMVATIAFGMGIDKPDVRFVAHLDLPKSVEGYYQETGRAGRDGSPADAWMAYGLADVVQQRRLIDMSNAGDEYKRVSVAKLDALLGLCETAGCRRVRLLAYFGEASLPCGNCDTCLAPPETYDATSAAQKALSAIYRTGQRFGAVHLIDVLRGKAGPRITRWEHDKLSVFGIGEDVDETAWRGVFRQLVAMGFARVDHEAHGALRLTEASRPVLKGTQRVSMRRAVPRVRSTRRPLRSGSVPVADLSAADNTLLERLKAWRLTQSRTQSVPAFVILHDKTLHAGGTADHVFHDEIGLRRRERHWRGAWVRAGEQIRQPAPALPRRDEAAPVGDCQFDRRQRARHDDRTCNDDAGGRLLLDHQISAEAKHPRLKRKTQHL